MIEVYEGAVAAGERGEGTALDGEVSVGEGLAIDVAFFCNGAFQEGLGEGAEEIVLGALKFAQVCEGFGEARVVVALEERDEVCADAVAREGWVALVASMR